MTWLSDAAVERLQEVVDLPDLAGTKYEIVEQLGRGGMGTVYLARDRDLEREVAIKVLRAPAPRPDEAARMLGEARILASLEHPGIVPVHDVGRLPDGRVYYVMKRVAGRPLSEHLRDGPPLVERLRLFLRICESVAFAHARGIVHRDLKPQNVMIGPFGEVLVMDWGVAKLCAPAGVVPSSVAAEPAPRTNAPSTGVETESGTVVGTPGYMAPEQLCGEVDSITEQTDVYALGALLRYLLTGSPTDAGAAGAPRVSPPASERSVPRALAAICSKAMAPSPADRYAGAEQLAGEVSRFLAALPVEAYREPVLERARRIAAKYRTPIVLVLAYLLMRIVLLFVRA